VNGLAKASTKAGTNTIKCTCCGQDKVIERNYYKSNSMVYKGLPESRIGICKECIISIYDYYLKRNEDARLATYLTCRKLDVVYIENVYTAALNESINKGTHLFGLYMKNINSLNQYSNYTFDESDEFYNKTEIEEEFSENSSSSITLNDKRNEEDVLRILGYDPFENENLMDKKYLYNRLIDFLDESTLEDSFKLPAVIEIVKSFNQIDKINSALAVITSDIKAVANNVGGVKSLIEAKDKMLRAVLALAKDNGISVNHNNNKSKGAGTLTGIIKQLQEKGFTEAEINLFDVETYGGIKQVADISNESILKQLMFDENDYTEMIKEQKILIEELRGKCEKAEEELRLFKIKNAQQGIG
jgi:hypothetical protein